MTRYRWVVLALGMFAQAAFAAILQGLPSMGPALRSEYGLSLSGFGAVLGAFTLGGTLALIPWGLLIDRAGERRSLAIGVGGCALAMWLGRGGGAGTLAGALLVAGALGAVANVASGSAVAGWFRPQERGFALGLRQAAVPLGGAIAALALPLVAAGSGPRGGLALLGGGCAVAAVACAVGVRDPADEARAPGPGPLRDRRIWRLAAGSALLLIAQASVIGFLAVFLHDERGFSAVAAGATLAGVQVAGVISRIGIGRWSDRLALRMGPLRWIAGAVAVSWMIIPLLLSAPDAFLLPALVVGAVLAFSWNGLSFTAAAEFGGSGRSGTAIALQQTVLFASAAVAAPIFGAIVEAVGWRTGFASLALGPLVALVLFAPLVRSEIAGPVS